MICPRCRAENGPGTRSCGQCGGPLAALCTVCGAANPADNRFCGQCAAPLSAGPAGAPDSAAPPLSSGEFRQVTVLFCDMVNSTGLAERLGDETLHEVLRRFLDAGIAEVHRYDGSVPQFTGDGFMALFGAPVAHEDHVRRALLAATAILRSVEGGAEGPETGQPPDLAIRVGVNTGLVVFGAVADNLRMDSTAIGDTANIAARLQAEAEPNSIVISEATLRLAGGYARAEPIGVLQLKGKSEPISAFRLLDMRSRPLAAGGQARFGARRFVGRERELARLEALLSRAEQAEGQAVGIAGEAGIGKSRLLAELRRRAEGACTWIEGHCLSYGTAIPYLLALDLLRGGCHIHDRDPPDEIADKLRRGLAAAGMDPQTDGPPLLALLGIGTGTDAPPRGGGQAKKRVFGLLRRFVLGIANDRPLVLALEDLHWVDKLSEEFLALLPESLPGSRLLIVATYRAEYRPGWVEGPNAAEIAIGPLAAAHSRRVLRSVLDKQHLPDELAARILARAEGNPFFLEQLALNVGEDGGRSVPATVRDVVMARIDRLPGPPRRLLQIAAVAGREFSLRLIREVWRGREALEPLLAELLQSEFLYERAAADDTVYVFRHALTQGTAYTGLLARDRRRGHAAVGRALESLYDGRTEEVAELLALHYGRSENADKAVDYALSAAEKAQRRWANAEALGYFEAALKRLDAMPDTPLNRRRRIDAVIKQVEVKLALGRHAEHVAALAGIAGIVEAEQDPHRRARWQYWMGFLGCLTGGHPAAAIAHCREAAAIAAEAGLDELGGNIQSCLAQAYIVAGELRAAIDAGKRALAILEPRASLLPAIRTLWHLSSAANYLGNWPASLDYCRRALDHADRLNDARLKGVTLWRIGLAHVVKGDGDTGLAYCREALALSPIPYDSAMARAVRGYALIRQGQPAAGIAELGDVVSWFTGSGLAYVRALATLWLVEGHLSQGDAAAAQPLAETVLQVSRSNGYAHYAAMASRLLAECLAERQPVSAERHLDAALRSFERIEARWDIAAALRAKARLRRAAGEAAAAEQLARRAEEMLASLRRPEAAARIGAPRLCLESPTQGGARLRPPFEGHPAGPAARPRRDLSLAQPNPHDGGDWHHG